MSADSIEGNPGGMDPYGYVGGNPETFIDPTGHHIADICEDDPAACDSNANKAQEQGVQGPYRGPSNGAPPDAGGIPAAAVVVDPVTIDVTVGDTQYLYTPDDGDIIVQGPDGEPPYLSPEDGSAYYEALDNITQSRRNTNAGDDATTPKGSLAGGDTGGGPTTITEVTPTVPTATTSSTSATPVVTTSSTPTTPSENNPLANVQYTDKVYGQRFATVNPDFHGFPDMVDNYGADGQLEDITGGDGVTRTRLRIAGWYRGYEGFFEYIIEPDGITVNHRYFNIR